MTSMFSTFPCFNKLTLSHREYIEKFVSKFPPYSDFNFTSLWIYNTDDSIEISSLYDNLVIKFTDYLTLKPFYSFLGTENIQKTIQILLDISKKNKYEEALRLIPEIVIAADIHLAKHYDINEDLDNYDYIVSADEISNLPHHKYRTKKNQIVQFKKLYPNHTLQLIDLSNRSNHKKVIDLFVTWEQKSGKTRSDTENEFAALKRLLNSIDYFHSYAVGIFDRNILIGFTIFEKTHADHGIYSFQKADRSYRGIFTYMCHEVAKILKEKGCTHINYEQDLGIHGLRTAKTLWKPVHFLKKYIITPKNNV